MGAVIFVPASGNQFREFQREADEAAKLWKAEIIAFPVLALPATQRKFVIDALLRKRSEPITRVAFFCHGFRNRIQPGFDLSTAADLAAALERVATPLCVVSLYCCSTGRSSRDDGAGPYVDGEGSFADRLRDELVARGFHGTTMLTHRTPGHLARNPDVRIFALTPDTLGGDDPCLRIPLAKNPSAAEKAAAVDLYRRFRGLLHTPTGRWLIADMTAKEIEAAARACAPYVDPPKRR